MRAALVKIWWYRRRVSRFTGFAVGNRVAQVSGDAHRLELQADRVGNVSECRVVHLPVTATFAQSLERRDELMVDAELIASGHAIDCMDQAGRCFTLEQKGPYGCR